MKTRTSKTPSTRRSRNGRKAPTAASRIRREAQEKLKRLPSRRLLVALDFLTYLEARESNEATLELERIPGLDRALASAEKAIRAGKLFDWRKARIDV